jgi:hypothetical protein
MPDLWGYSDAAILAAAERKSGQPVVGRPSRTSGLYAYVTLADGNEVAVYPQEVRS